MLGSPPLCTTHLPTLRDANGNNMKVLGRYRQQFNINKQSFSHEFLVCPDVPRHVILGKDFAIQNAAGVSYGYDGRRTLRVHESIIADEQYENNAKPPDATLRLRNSLRLQPRQSAVVMCISSQVLTGTTAVTGSPLLHEDYCAVRCHPITYSNPADQDGNFDQRTELPYPITNFSSTETIYLPANTVVATARNTTEEVHHVYLADDLKDYIVGEEEIRYRNWVSRDKQERIPHPLVTDFILNDAEQQKYQKIALQDANISDSTKQKFEELADRFKTIFSKDNCDIGRSDLITMDIDTGDSPPVAQRPYPLALKHYDWVKQEIENLERAGVIVESMSKWASPVVVVPKKSAPDEPPRRRLCVDFRKINQLAPKIINGRGGTKGTISLEPLPRIDEIFPLIRGAKIFSTLDLRSGYYHIELTDDAKEKTAFVTPFGKYQFTRVPFGLAQAPAYFQKLIKQVVKGLSFAIAYLDDIIIFSDNEEQHLEHLEIIFERLRRFNLKLKFSKCDFFKSQIEYLGHLITPYGIRPIPGKLRAIQDMPAPRTVKQVKQFLGLVGYYRKFIPRFSDIAKPLTLLTRKNTQFHWSAACANAFNDLKRKLAQGPILKYPDPSKPYILYTDASKYGWGGVLTQKHETKTVEGEEVVTDHPIAYVSGLFRGSQESWATLTKEAYAILQSCKKLAYYIDSSDVTVHSDHKPLEKFMNQSTNNPKVNNWGCELSAMGVRFKYITGKSNELADPLSRLLDVDDRIKLAPEEDGVEFGVPCMDDLPRLPGVATGTDLEDLPPTVHTQQVTQYLTDAMCATIETKLDPDQRPVQISFPLAKADLRQLQSEDTDCIRTIERLTTTGKEDLHFIILDGILHRKLIHHGRLYTPVYLPNIMKGAALAIAHDKSGHSGAGRVYAAMRFAYYWKGIKNDVYKYIKQCPNCVKHTLNTVKYEPGHFKVPTLPMQFIAMDTIGDYPETSRGNKYALTAVCMLTGYTFCIPLPNKRADTVANAYIKHIYSLFGGSDKILTDNGTEFKNEIMDKILEKLGVQKRAYSAPYRPQSNGRVEGFHRFLKSCTGKLAEAHRLEWDQVAHLATAAYNFFPNENSGESAFFLMFGRDPIIPLYDLLEPDARYVGESRARLSLQELQNVYRRVATQLEFVRRRRDKNLPNHDHKFQEGDMVTVRDPTAPAFHPKYKGDYRIEKFLGKNMVRLINARGQVKQHHVAQLKKTDMVDRVTKDRPDYTTTGRLQRLTIRPDNQVDLGWSFLVDTPTTQEPDIKLEPKNSRDIPCTIAPQSRSALEIFGSDVIATEAVAQLAASA